MLSPVYTKLTKQDVEICRAFQNLIKQGKFELQGSAVQQGGSLFAWFSGLDKRIEETIKDPPPETIRKEVGEAPPEKKGKKMSFTHQDATDANDNALVVIKGGTDNTAIGNVSDRLKVDAQITTITSGGDELATFVVLAKDVAIGNNKSMLSLVNTTGSTVKIKIRELYLINSQTAAVTGVISDFEIHRCVSHSGGTALTPQSYDTADSLDASVTARTGATIGTENAAILKRWEWSSDEWGVGTLDQEGNDHNTQTNINLMRQEKNCKPLTLRANEGFTFKHVINSTAGTFDIMCVFTQEAL